MRILTMVWSATYVWVIDPLDGTTAFVQGPFGWGISIGLLHEGQPSFGLFYMPLLGDMTHTGAHSVVSTAVHVKHQSVRKDWVRRGSWPSAPAHTTTSESTCAVLGRWAVSGPVWSTPHEELHLLPSCRKPICGTW